MSALCLYNDGNGYAQVPNDISRSWLYCSKRRNHQNVMANNHSYEHDIDGVLRNYIPK